MDNTRYIRQNKLIGQTGQQLLHQANVLLIGAGGLGCVVGSFLAAAGVGKITLIDHDIVEISNLTRQIMYTENDCGRPKVEVLKNHLESLNSTCQITAIFAELSIHNDAKLVSTHDIVVDCSDNFISKYLIGDACSLYDKPLITASINEFMGQILVIFPYMCYRCVFQKAGDTNSCVNDNVVGPTVGIVASYQANEVFKLIIGFNSFSYLIQIDSLNNVSNNFKISAETQCINNHSDYYHNYESRVLFKSFSEIHKLYKIGQIKLIDISEHKSSEVINPQIPYDQPIAVICNFGYRSKLTALKLAKAGYKKVYFSNYLNP